MTCEKYKVIIEKINKEATCRNFRQVQTKGLQNALANRERHKKELKMTEEDEDAILLAEAQKRLLKKTEYKSHEEIMKGFGLSEKDLMVNLKESMGV